jgi:hypothetical protein
MTVVTDPQHPPRPPAPDPTAYDAPRNAIARNKGLEQPVITGGGDPGLPSAKAEDRRLSRLLLAMVAIIVASGFIIGILIALAGPTGGR